MHFSLDRAKSHCRNYTHFLVINPRRACAARFTVVAVSVCLSVCLCVSPLSDISTLELLFVMKPLSRTQRAMKVEIAFSL